MVGQVIRSYVFDIWVGDVFLPDVDKFLQYVWGFGGYKICDIRFGTFL